MITRRKLFGFLGAALVPGSVLPDGQNDAPEIPQCGHIDSSGTVLCRAVRVSERFKDGGRAGHYITADYISTGGDPIPPLIT